MLTFIIHNEQDEQRKQSFLKQTEEQGILEYEVMPALMIPKFGRKGISQSHKACVRLAKEAGKHCVHILEDDFWFLKPGAYKRFLDIYFSEVPDDCDLYFGGNYDGVFTPITPRLALAEEKKSGLMSYIVNHRFYDKFLSADESYNIDHYLTAPDLLNAKCYTAYPFVSLQFDGLSYNTGMMTKYNEHIGKRYRLWDGNN